MALGRAMPMAETLLLSVSSSASLATSALACRIVGHGRVGRGAPLPLLNLNPYDCVQRQRRNCDDHHHFRRCHRWHHTTGEGSGTDCCEWRVQVVVGFVVGREAGRLAFPSADTKRTMATLFPTFPFALLLSSSLSSSSSSLSLPLLLPIHDDESSTGRENDGKRDRVERRRPWWPRPDRARTMPPSPITEDGEAHGERDPRPPLSSPPSPPLPLPLIRRQQWQRQSRSFASSSSASAVAARGGYSNDNNGDNAGAGAAALDTRGEEKTKEKKWDEEDEEDREVKMTRLENETERLLRSMRCYLDSNHDDYDYDSGDEGENGGDEASYLASVAPERRRNRRRRWMQTKTEMQRDISRTEKSTFDQLMEEWSALLDDRDAGNSMTTTKSLSDFECKRYGKGGNGHSHSRKSSGHDADVAWTAAEHVESLLEALEDNYDNLCDMATMKKTNKHRVGANRPVSALASLVPNDVSYNLALRAYAVAAGASSSSSSSSSSLVAAVEIAKISTSSYSSSNAYPGKRDEDNNITDAVAAAEKAMRILEKMINRCKSYASSSLSSSSSMSLSRAIPNAIGPAINAKKEKERFRRGYKRNIDRGRIFTPPPPEPTAISFNTVINAWARTCAPNAGENAERVFRMMEDWNLDFLNRHIDNDNDDYDYDDYYHDKGIDGLNDGKNNEYKQAGSNVAFVSAFRYRRCDPTVRTYAGIVEAWANSNRGKYAADRALTILELVLEKCREAAADEVDAKHAKDANLNSDPWSDGSAPNRALGTGNPRAGARSRHRGRAYAYAPIPPLPDVILFNSVMNAIRKSGQGTRGAEMAQDLLDRMIDLDGSVEYGIRSDGAVAMSPFPLDLKPNTRTLSLVLDAWAQCSLESGNGGGDKDNNNTPLRAARRAENILTRMEELHAKGYDVKPNAVSYTTCITAYARCRGHDGAAERAESILDRMIAMSSRGRTKGTEGGEGLEFGKGGEGEGDRVGPLPGLWTGAFNSVITAWARSGRPDGARRAESILRRLESLGIADTTSYNAVIDALAKARGRRGRSTSGGGGGGVGREAARLVERMERHGIRPDLITYNSAIQALARDRCADSAREADSLLRRLERSIDDDDDDGGEEGSGWVDGDDSPSKHGDIGLNAITYSSCMNAYAWSSDPKKAEKARALLDRMIERSDRCDVGSSGAATERKKGEGGDGGRNRRLSQSRRGCPRPDVVAYVSCLNACANTNGSESDIRTALRIAIMTFEELKERSATYGNPNEYVYGSMLKACARLSSDSEERGRLLGRVFDGCCRDGFVTDRNLDIFWRGAPIDVRNRFIDEGSGLPPSWYRNVRDGDRPYPKISMPSLRRDNR